MRKVCKVTKTLFEFHTNRTRGVEEILIAIASAQCWFTKVWTNCISVETLALQHKEHKNLHPESYQHCNSPAFV